MYRRLRANQDGIVSATTVRALVPPVEGEALVTAGDASIFEAARAAELDESVMARGAMQTVRPKSVRRVPGLFTVYDETSGGGQGPDFSAVRESPEQPASSPEAAATGLPVVAREQKSKWPWWLLLVAGGIAWMAFRKR